MSNRDFAWPEALTSLLDIEAAGATNGYVTERYLSDLAGYFADEPSYRQSLRSGDPLLYRVTTVEPADGPGDLHFGIAMLMPGQIGDEYFMTKGHFHERREAAEIYLVFSGKGFMLLENEQTGESRVETLQANGIVYVPGHTAHRTINTGDEPLVYIGILPADAGHDYGVIAEHNFNLVVVASETGPRTVARVEHLKMLEGTGKS